MPKVAGTPKQMVHEIKFRESIKTTMTPAIAEVYVEEGEVRKHTRSLTAIPAQAITNQTSIHLPQNSAVFFCKCATPCPCQQAATTSMVACEVEEGSPPRKRAKVTLSNELYGQPVTALYPTDAEAYERVKYVNPETGKEEEYATNKFTQERYLCDPTKHHVFPVPRITLGHEVIRLDCQRSEQPCFRPVTLNEKPVPAILKGVEYLPHVIRSRDYEQGYHDCLQIMATKCTCGAFGSSRKGKGLRNPRKRVSKSSKKIISNADFQNVDDVMDTGERVDTSFYQGTVVESVDDWIGMEQSQPQPSTSQMPVSLVSEIYPRVENESMTNAVTEEQLQERERVCEQPENEMERIAHQGGEKEAEQDQIRVVQMTAVELEATDERGKELEREEENEEVSERETTASERGTTESEGFSTPGMENEPENELEGEVRSEGTHPMKTICAKLLSGVSEERNNVENRETGLKIERMEEEEEEEYREEEKVEIANVRVFELHFNPDDFSISDSLYADSGETDPNLGRQSPSKLREQSRRVTRERAQSMLPPSRCTRSQHPKKK